MKIGIYAPDYPRAILTTLRFYHAPDWEPCSPDDQNSGHDQDGFIIFSSAEAPQIEDRTELGERPFYEYRRIADPTALTEIREAIESREIAALLFDSLSSYRAWSAEQNTESCTLYFSPGFKLLDASPEAVKACRWISLRNLTYSRLREEEIPVEANITVHETAAHWQDHTESILITRNRALISYLVKKDALHCQILHLDQVLPALNLNLDQTPEDLRLERVHRMLELSRKILQEDCKYILDGIDKKPEPASGSAYNFFARIYDDYMAHVDYSLWVGAIYKWQKRYGGSKASRILEIACGTANISGLMVFDGYQVDACDASWQMLCEAEAKLFKPRLFLRSMTEPLPELDYDLILCLFDSINYLQQKSEIRTLLQYVAKALRPGGIFIFDISTLYNSLENFADNINFSRDASGYLVHHAEYEEFSKLQKSNLYHFRKTGQGFELETERHVQRVYRSYEIVELIDKSPLKLVAIHTTESPNNLIQKRHSPLDEKYSRLFFVLKREG